MNNLPISPDNALPIPAPLGLMELLIILTFIIHILFVNFTVSLVTGAVGLEIAGKVKKSAFLDKMAKSCSFHASIHKSIAVVMGVAPLLIISVIYTQYFYSSTILIGKIWISVIPLLIIAFLLLYLYKFTWDKWQNKKALHILVGFAAMLILLYIPLIFIVNITSMLYPDKWGEVQGFFPSLLYYPQIWQRYLHFILASLATGGFYVFLFYEYKSRKKGGLEDYEQSLKLFGAKVSLWITVVQLIAGFILLFAFKPEVRMLFMGEDLLLTTLLMLSIVLTIILCVFLFLAGYKDSFKSFVLSAAVFVLIVSIMGWIRHEVRETYLSPYFDEFPRTEQSMEK